jgi:hypothetical protein
MREATADKGDFSGANAMTIDTQEPRPMGRVVTEITVESLKDLYAAEQGLISADQVRRLVIPDAVVDRGATFPSQRPNA